MTIRVPKALLLALLGVALVGGVGVGGYATGRSSIDKDAIRREARAQGARAGVTQGTGQARKVTQSQRTEEFRSGAQAALLGLGPKPPEVGRYYIVNFRRGTPRLGPPYQVDESFNVSEGIEYSICDDGHSICKRSDG